MMDLYKKYSYEPSFCAFHKLLTNLLSSNLEADKPMDECFVRVSKYLKLSVVDSSYTPREEEDKGLYPLSDFYVDDTINKDIVNKITYEQIIVPSNMPKTKLEVLIDCIKRDYRKGMFQRCLILSLNGNLVKSTLKSLLFSRCGI